MEPKTTGAGMIAAAANPEPLLLDLGSGPRVAANWVSIDASWNARLARWPRVRRLAAAAGLLSVHHAAVPWPSSGILGLDVRRGLPFATGSVDGIFAAHFLEHLTPCEAKALLRECRRVLVAGGRIRLIVPDLEALVHEYLEGLQQDPQTRAAAAERFLASLNLAALWPWPRTPAWTVARLLSRAGHRSLHDRHSLASLLESSGFGDAGCRAYLQSGLPFLEQVETESHHQASICLEAVRQPQLTEP